jgi:hypothetical protein
MPKKKPVLRAVRSNPPKKTKPRAAVNKAAVGAEDDVATFLRTWTHPLKRELELVRRLILATDPKIREGIKWNSLSFRTTDDFATLNGPRHTQHVMVILHTGAKAKGIRMRDRVEDPHGLLAWRGADRALVAFEDARELRAKRAAFQALVRSWTRGLAGN